MSKLNLKIAFLSSSDPHDKKVWSGTQYSIFQTTKSHFETVVSLGPYTPKFSSWVGKILTGISQLIFKKRYNYRHSYLMARSYSRYFEKKLKEEKFDLILAPAALCELAELKTDIPIVYISDNTVDVSINYHKSLSDLLPFSDRETRRLEKKVLNKSATIIVSSNWALDSLRTHYHLPEEKTFCVPFGANMENIPSREEVFRKVSGKVCKLLFMGVYWDNKGGDIAYNCLLELLKLGVDAELSICGCIPPENYQHEKMNVIPFLDKNSEEGRKKLQSIFSSHDFLILPTRFDCTPIVICEASAFGMPSLVANTGGVAGHLKEGINGFLIDYKDTGEGYAKKIKEIFEDKDRFNSLRQTSRKLYEEELNWEKYGEELEKILLRI